jgi:hypothetical protein
MILKKFSPKTLSKNDAFLLNELSSWRGFFKNRFLFFCAGGVQCRVARWYVFKPKIKIWVNFGGA